MNPIQELAMKKAALKREIAHSHEKLDLHLKLLAAQFSPEAILLSAVQKVVSSETLTDLREMVDE